MGKRIVVTGAGGFIGGHLVNRLLDEGNDVLAIDVKKFNDWWQLHEGAGNISADLREEHVTHSCVGSADEVYHLAANMGGMGWITTMDAEIIRDNTMIDINVLNAAVRNNVGRLLYSSSACVYPVTLQRGEGSVPLRECDVYPALPQHAYGWQKLHTEHICRYYREANLIDTRVVRFHNTYGPYGSWNDGKEKAPAALCRKVAYAKRFGNHEIEVWGDGTAVRSYLFIDDCVDGLIRLMASDYTHPLNLGTDVPVTVDELAYAAAEVAGINITIKHIEGPVGVQWRNSDNALCRIVLGWEPKTQIREGLRPTFRWICDALSRIR